MRVNGTRVRVANTHLQHERVERARRAGREDRRAAGRGGRADRARRRPQRDVRRPPSCSRCSPASTTPGRSAAAATGSRSRPRRRIGASTTCSSRRRSTCARPSVRPTLASDHLPVTAKLTIAKRSRELAATTFNAPRAAEAKFAFTASAPNTDWSRRGLEAAVVTVLLDGEPTQDVVLYSGARQFTYRVALGRVGRRPAQGQPRAQPAQLAARRRAGPHVRPDAPGSPRAGDLVARHAPILYGRDLPEIAGRWENARTDVPMLAYHASTPGADGTRTIEYTVIWSNEDGGTNSPALMARWGRTTDIEWIYRVRVDAAGNALDAVYHGPNHEVLPFTGAKENDHPLLQTATSNNNLLQVDRPGADARLPLLPRHRGDAAGRPHARGGDGRRAVDLPGDGQGDAARGPAGGRRATRRRRRSPTSATTSTSNSTPARAGRRRHHAGGARRTTAGTRRITTPRAGRSTVTARRPRRSSCRPARTPATSRRSRPSASRPRPRRPRTGGSRSRRSTAASCSAATTCRARRSCSGAGAPS